MTDTNIPPLGPARDRLVAEAVGWHFEDNMVVDCRDFDYPIKRIPSDSDADALAALEAWADAGVGTRRYSHHRWTDGRHNVMLVVDEGLVAQGIAPTIADAATAALAAWQVERSGT